MKIVIWHFWNFPREWKLFIGSTPSSVHVVNKSITSVAIVSNIFPILEVKGWVHNAVVI